MDHTGTRAKLFILPVVALAILPGAPGLGDIPASSVQQTIERLASPEFEGRRTGTPGNDRAARYLAERFRAAGLKPLGTRRQSDLKARMDGSGYFQPFAVAAGMRPGPKCALAVLTKGQRRTYRLERDFVPTGSSASGSVTGALVLVGYGVQSTLDDRDDYASADVKGKVVVALDGAPTSMAGASAATARSIRRKAQLARDKGAVALILCRPSGPPTQAVRDGRGDAGIPIVAVDRTIVSAWCRTAGKDLAEIEKAAQTTAPLVDLAATATVTTDIAKATVPSANLVGLLPGSDPKLRDEFVVIGGHMDHLGMGGQGSLAGGASSMHPGADDNASGAAGVVALADYIGSLTSRPRRSILFMEFTGEEEGLLGSAWYTKNPILPHQRTVAMINLDMIGRMSDSKLSAIGVGSSPAWRPMLSDLGADKTFRLTMGDSAMGGSDHQSFYTAHIPVLFLFTGTHPDYHKPTDTADKINSLDEARVLDLAASLALRLANADTRPEFTEMAPAANTGRTRARVTLGGIPDYAGDRTDGVLLGGVTAGGPLQRAGAAAGDIVVQIGTRSVRSVEDYMGALGDLVVGKQIVVVVKRGAKTINLDVTPTEPPARTGS